ncbi:MAG TPA: hypothetical protein VGB30_01695 [bacterium]|jgi:DNA repair ATPase RecN
MKRKISYVRARLYTGLVISNAARGLAIAAIVCALLMAVGKFANLNIDIIRTCALILIGGTGLGAIYALLKRVTVFDAAVACDVHLGLKERISSALEFEDQAETHPLVPPLLEDANNFAKKINPIRDFPFRLPRELVWALIFIVVTVGLNFVPTWKYAVASPEEKEELQQVQQEAERVREIALELETSAPEEISEEAKELAAELKELAEDMEFGNVTRREALERLAEIEQKIENLENEQGLDELMEQLGRMAADLAGSEELSELSDALREGDNEAARRSLDQLAQNLEQGRVPLSNFNDIADKLNQAAESLGNNPDMQSMRQALQEAANAMNEASGEQGGENQSQDQGDPEDFARELIDAIQQAMDDVERSDRIPEDVKEAALDTMDDVMQDLQDAMREGSLDWNKITEAQRRLNEVAQMLQEYLQPTLEEQAEQLVEQARQLEELANQMESLSPEQRQQAASSCQNIGSQLQQQMQNGSLTQESINEASDRLQELADQLQNHEQTAKELIQEAQRLQKLAESMNQMSPEQREQLSSQCQGVADQLSENIQQGQCSLSNNQDARQQLDEVRRQLEQNGASQDQMGNKTQCQNPGSGQQGQQGQNGQGQQGQSGLQSMMGMCKMPGNMGNNGMGQSQQAGDSMRSLANSIQKLSNQMNASQCLSRARLKMSQCRSGMCQGGNNSQNGGQSSQNGRAGNSWGVGTSSYAVGPSPVSQGNQNDPSLDPDEQNTSERPFEQIYKPRYDQNQSFDTFVSGEFSDDGGSYVFIQKADPETGETSYVPYFELQPSDVDSLMDAVEDQEIPRTYEDMVRYYFEQLAHATASGDEASE